MKRRDLDISEPVPTRQCLKDMVHCIMVKVDEHPRVRQARVENQAVASKLAGHWYSIQVWMACVITAFPHKIQLHGKTKAVLDKLIDEADKGWPFKPFIVDEMGIRLLMFLKYFRTNFPESSPEIMAIMSNMIGVVKETKA